RVAEEDGGVLRQAWQLHQPYELIRAPKTSVPSERFIAAVARQRADDAPIADGLGDEIGRKQAGIGKRLVEMEQQLLRQFRRDAEISRRDGVMVGPVMI